MSSREQSLNTAACRLLHSIMPGMETAAIFQDKVRGSSAGRELLLAGGLPLSPVCLTGRAA